MRDSNPAINIVTPIRTTHTNPYGNLTIFINKKIRRTSENTHTKGAQTWTPQKENNAEQRGSFVLKQTYFDVNNDMQQHGNTLT
jgi:hypothetical protein